MFENLSDKLQQTFRNITGTGKISEKNVQDALRDIRLALLEADVNYKVVKDFVAQVKADALGQEVIKGLNPGQQLVKVVNEKLVDILGGRSTDLRLEGPKPHVIMMVGLQGSGKTTSSGKLARLLAEQGRRPYLVPADVYRPAAIKQLQTVGEQIGVPVFPSDGSQKPLDIAKQAMREAKNAGRDLVILDTAGRLHIDETLMDELKELKAFLKPDEILFVADAMTGQDAVTSAKSFHQALEVSGVILTKMDGDARGGAALSIKKVTDRPIKFVGTGEKLDAFEKFHPDRMASRILGMGDVLSLVEQMQAKVDQEEAEKLQKAMMKNQFTLEDFRKAMIQLNRVGDLNNLMGLIPGMSQIKKQLDLQSESKQMGRMQAIISSMTKEERVNHAVLNNSRKERIAKGSGVSVKDVNTMLTQFMQMKKMMGMMTNPGKVGKLGQMFKRAGLGNFANAVLPGMTGSPGASQLPADIDEQQLMEIARQHGGKLPPEVMKQLGLSSPHKSISVNRPKKDRKKEKAKRKQGRKKK